MSSAPSGQPGQPGQQGQPGQPGQPGPNGAPNPRPRMVRRKRPADPLVARKKPQQRPPSAPTTTILSGANRSGITALSLPSEARTLNTVNPEDEAKKLAAFNEQRKANGGWTDAMPEGTYRDFPVVTTKRALREGIRYHVMRFAKAKGGDDEAEIDPTNQDDFTRPVSLHRRDPRQPAPGRAAKEEREAAAAAAEAAPATTEEKEAEKAMQIRAEREAQRVSDMAQIAPVGNSKDGGGGGGGKKPAPMQRKEKQKQYQLYYPKSTPAQKKETEIRYEEALPWHLEDADGKQVWVGGYIAALSEANVGLVIDGSAFRMVPLEKYYRFTPKPPFRAYSTEQAEEIMAKKMAAGRWAMRDDEKRKQREELEETRRTIGGRARVKLESSTFRSAPRSEKMDHNDIDMEGDEFQDDDENVGLEPDNDEDSKDTRDRQRRNHLGANLFGDADEHEVDKEEKEAKEDRLARNQGALGKQIRKALAKREDHLEYLEYRDSDTNSEKEDFLELSSDDDEDEEDKKEDEKGKDGKDKDGKDVKDKDGKDKDGKDKDKDGKATPKGGLTPQGKHKAGDGKKSKSLKRPGSPNLSESSGNESSRKKKAKKHANGSSLHASRASTPLSGQPRKAGGSKSASGLAAGAGGAQSDGEATGGEMSDGPGKRRIKIVAKGGGGGGSGGTRATPGASRAGSPNPAQGPLSPGSNSGSPGRAGSPTAAATAAVAAVSGKVDAAEMLSTLQRFPDGITVGALLKVFGSRIGDGPNQMMRKDWIKLVKENSVFGDDKMLRAKQSGSG